MLATGFIMITPDCEKAMFEFYLKVSLSYFGYEFKRNLQLKKYCIGEWGLVTQKRRI
jgi:hypothetical protein